MTVVDCVPMKVHLDRTTAGFHVEVGEIPLTGEWVLQGTSSNFRARVPILPEQRIDAYLHPCSFLPNADRFFRELREGEVADETGVISNGEGMHLIKDELEPEDSHILTMAESTDPMDYCMGCNQSMMAHETGAYCDRCNGNDDGS
jgi:hypothetical protein